MRQDVEDAQCLEATKGGSVLMPCFRPYQTYGGCICRKSVSNGVINVEDSAK